MMFIVSQLTCATFWVCQTELNANLNKNILIRKKNLFFLRFLPREGGKYVFLSGKQTLYKSFLTQNQPRHSRYEERDEQCNEKSIACILHSVD